MVEALQAPEYHPEAEKIQRVAEKLQSFLDTPWYCQPDEHITPELYDEEIPLELCQDNSELGKKRLEKYGEQVRERQSERARLSYNKMRKNWFAKVFLLIEKEVEPYLPLLLAQAARKRRLKLTQEVRPLAATTPELVQETERLAEDVIRALREMIRPLNI